MDGQENIMQINEKRVQEADCYLTLHISKQDLDLVVETHARELFLGNNVQVSVNPKSQTFNPSKHICMYP